MRLTVSASCSLTSPSTYWMASIPSCGEKIADVAEFQDRITIIHKGVEVPLKGNGFMGISPREVVAAHARKRRDEGVQINFGTRIADPAPLQGYDLIVGADGVNSAVRTALNDHFRAAKEPRLNKWVWYATPKRLTFGRIDLSRHRIWYVHRPQLPLLSGARNVCDRVQP